MIIRIRTLQNSIGIITTILLYYRNYINKLVTCFIFQNRKKYLKFVYDYHRHYIMKRKSLFCVFRRPSDVIMRRWVYLFSVEQETSDLLDKNQSDPCFDCFECSLGLELVMDLRGSSFRAAIVHLLFSLFFRHLLNVKWPSKEQ